MGKTSIQWTDESWNPVVGCTRVSPGCKNCYAFALHDMRHEAYKNGSKVPEQYAKPFTEIQLMEDRLDTPLRRRKPTMWFVNSVSDLFHPDVPDWFIDEVLGVAALTPRHTYQILTKRPERMADMLTHSPRHNGGSILQSAFIRQRRMKGGVQDARLWPEPEWPLKNVWFGTSVESQKQQIRFNHLHTLKRYGGAAITFCSAEPLLGPLILSGRADGFVHNHLGEGGLDWVIVGGESGNGARPCNIEWIRDIRDQCKAAGVACFIKQLGSVAFADEIPRDMQFHREAYRLPNREGQCRLVLKDSHGGDWDEWPEDLRVREFPESAIALTGG